MEKYFNVAGPCFPADHYMLPALDRIPGIRRLIERKMYFDIHAPRQTGKTTAVQALVREINAEGERCALYCSLETLQNATDPARSADAIRGLLLFAARNTLPQFFTDSDAEPRARETGPTYAAETIAVREVLTSLCRRFGKPLVVFFDEADCLAGNVLISFLRQLRDGYVNRAAIPFPDSIALIGMLDVRDYKAQIRPDGESLGQISPFNIITKDLMPRNFTEAEIAALYAQHTEATGQVFEPEALAKAWEFTSGQPWLVNALARECVEEIHGFDYEAPVTAADMECAKETIISRRDTHVDSLMERLREPRVRRVVEPVIFGGASPVSRDSEDYQEALPHLVLMAFLKRVTNGDGHILREMALGSRRLDLCVEYRGRRYAVEVKTAKNFAGEKSYARLASHLDSLGLAEGWMPVFDDDAGKPWDERLFTRDVTFGGKTIHVVGL